MVTPGGKIAGGIEADQAVGPGGSKADRSHAAVEPGDLYRPVRPRAKAVRGDQDGACSPVRCRTFLVQRGQGPMRDLRRVKGLSSSSCCSCPASTRRAQPAMVRVITRRRWKSSIAEKSIAEVLGLTVDAAWEFFAEELPLRRSLDVLRQVGLGYLRLGQPATELSGGEAQRIKLATELQRTQRGATRSTFSTSQLPGLHPADVDRLMAQLDGWSKREHGDRGGARHARRRRQRLGDGHRSRSRRRRREDCCLRNASRTSV